MGPAKVEVQSSLNIWKKRLKSHQYALKKKPNKLLLKYDHNPGRLKKPPVPKRTDTPGACRESNEEAVLNSGFVHKYMHRKKQKQNEAAYPARALPGMPRKTQPAMIETPKGHMEHLENSGHPQYIRKYDFGAEPEYCQR